MPVCSPRAGEEAFCRYRTNALGLRTLTHLNTTFLSSVVAATKRLRRKALAGLD